MIFKVGKLKENSNDEFEKLLSFPLCNSTNFPSTINTEWGNMNVGGLIEKAKCLSCDAQFDILLEC